MNNLTTTTSLLLIFCSSYFIEFVNPRAINKQNKLFGVSEITVDSGAGTTIIPKELADALQIPKPLNSDDCYMLFCGVGGM